MIYIRVSFELRNYNTLVEFNKQTAADYWRSELVQTGCRVTTATPEEIIEFKLLGHQSKFILYGDHVGYEYRLY